MPMGYLSGCAKNGNVLDAPYLILSSTMFNMRYDLIPDNSERFSARIIRKLIRFVLDMPIECLARQNAKATLTGRTIRGTKILFIVVSCILPNEQGGEDCNIIPLDMECNTTPPSI